MDTDDTACLVLESYNQECGEIHDENGDDDNYHLTAAESDAGFQRTDDADAALHRSQCGQEVREEQEDFCLFTVAGNICSESLKIVHTHARKQTSKHTNKPTSPKTNSHARNKDK